MHFLKKIFKQIHGYEKYCGSGKCKICNTPWPKIKKTFTEKYLESINYYNNYIEIIKDKHTLIMPKGINGQELIEISKILKPKYDILTKGKSEQEIIKRGALSDDYNKNNHNKKI